MLLPGLSMVSPALCTKHKDPENPVDLDHFLSMEFETPHTKWAKPYAGGPIRVLFLTDWYQNSTHTREIIELLQRFDIRAEAAMRLLVSGGLVAPNDLKFQQNTLGAPFAETGLAPQIADLS